jgi:hypothetical protein
MIFKGIFAALGRKTCLSSYKNISKEKLTKKGRIRFAIFDFQKIQAAQNAYCKSAPAQGAHLGFTIPACRNDGAFPLSPRERAGVRVKGWKCQLHAA